MNQPNMTPSQLRRAADEFKKSAEKFGHLLDNMPLPNSTTNPEDRRFIDEYRAEPRYAEAMTEREYVAMRRVDVGLDQLMPTPT